MTMGKALNGKPYGKCGITSILVGVACMAMASARREEKLGRNPWRGDDFSQETAQYCKITQKDVMCDKMRTKCGTILATAVVGGSAKP